MARESLLVATLVELADNLVDSYDVIEILTVLSDRCVQVIDVAAAGVMLATPGGSSSSWRPRVSRCGSSSCTSIQAHEGPCVDCVVDGTAIVNYDLDAPDGRWPRFTPRAVARASTRPLPADATAWAHHRRAQPLS